MASSRITPLAALLATLVVAPAAQAQTHSFEGSCALRGTIAFARPLALLPSLSPDGFVAAYTGTCNGKLDGEALPATGAPVAIANTGSFLPAAGCLAALTLNTNGVVTLFPGDPREATLRGGDTIVGAVGGVESGIGHGALSGLAAEYGLIAITPEVSEQCTQGTLRQVALTVHTQTITPIVG